ncbi:MAG TPA: glycerol-3-phosphate dehydrogenase [Casimicrobiaceae bacterium]|nr:glycerol-3-phosphate dehydrogenase [Casimicrobiaceae bacterium]
MNTRPFDLLVIGGGINGVGIARDAAGRGLSVLLVEKDDLAAHTSSASTKLIHGGLRYLEHYEFRLVAEALAERELLLGVAPHIIEPLLFVLPHEPHLRPAWMIRAGLLLYDRLGGRMTLPKSFGVRLDASDYGAGLRPRFRKGFVYADARVDDARLVVCNALDARARGADIRVRTTLTHAQRENGLWRATLRDAGGAASEVTARALVNAAGPWVRAVLGDLAGVPVTAGVRHVKGSHITVPRVHDKPHAYILQNADNRIVFVIPYQQRYSLIGTTDVPVERYAHPEISEEETNYLLSIANTYLQRPLSASDIVWTYSGVRPLYDDGSRDPSAITRDYVLQLEASRDATGAPLAPVLSIFGGKITTYRKLAEAALAELKPFFPAMGVAWTQKPPLPGGDLPNRDRDAWLAELARRYPALPGDVLRGLGRRHGTRVLTILGDARAPADLGIDFGNGLTEREIGYLQRDEWASTADDVLWRRTKCGLGMTREARERVAEWMAR